MGKVIKGAVVGGIILWIWSLFFWVFSGIPAGQMKVFKDPAMVEKVLRENAVEPGYYVMPTAKVPEGADPQKVGEARMKKVNEEFFTSGSVRVGGLGSFGKQIGSSVGGNFLSAALATLLLLHTTGLSFGRRWLFVVLLAVTTWVVGHWPMVVWYGHPFSWERVWLLDVVAGWSLAGLGIAWATKEN